MHYGTPVALTDRSQMDTASLLVHLNEVRRRGWEVTVDDVTVGLSAVAVPIRADRDQVAALSLGGLTSRLLDDAGAPLHVEKLTGAAQEVSAHLRTRFT